MEAASGPTRHSSTSPHVARRTPYARPAAATLEDGAGRPSDQRASGLLGSLMRKGLSWIAGNHQPASTARGGDEEAAVDSRRGGLSRSMTMPSMPDAPAAGPSNRRYAPPSVPASLSAVRSSSPDRQDGRRRTQHSTLNLPNSASSSTFSASRSYQHLPNTANGSDIFRPPSRGLSQADPYHPSSAYLRSKSPFASPGPAMGNLHLRSPSPALPSPPRSPTRGEALYPGLPNSRKRALSPLNPGSERSYAGSATGRPMAWSPTRGHYGQSIAGSSIAGSSRRGDVFGRAGSALGDEIPTVPQNEAERILNVLDSMRTPHGGLVRHSTRRIDVPIAVPSASNGLGYASNGRTAFISPYSRRQELEREQRQDARRSTLSEALRQRDLDLDARKRDRRRDPARQPSKLSQRIERDRDHERLGDEEMDEDSSPKKRERERTRDSEPRRAPLTRRRAKAQVTSPDRNGMDEDPDAAAEEDEMTPPKRRKRGGTPRLPSPGRSAAKRPKSKSPVPPVPQPPSSVSAPLEQKRPAPREPQTTSLRPGRTHTTRQHVKATTTVFSADDEDEPADYEALSKVAVPKITFPQGFSFGTHAATSTSTPPSTIAAPVVAVTSSEAPPATLSAAVETPKPAPLFSFAPVAPAPVPAPFPAADKAIDKPSQLAPSQPESVAQPAATAVPASAAPPSPANPFASFKGFGAAAVPAQSEESVPKAAFSFAAAPKAPSLPFTGFGSPAVPPAAELAPAAPSNDDAMAADEESAPLVEASKPVEASSAPVFSFGAAAPAPSTAPFSFGSAPATTVATSTASAPASNPFAAFGGTSSAPAVTSAPVFSFSPAVSAPQTSQPSMPAFSFSKPADPPASTSAPFTFGKPAETVALTPMPNFGATSPPLASGSSTPFALATPASSAPGSGASTPFTFGQPASTGMELSKSAETPGSSGGTSGGMFTFGTSSVPPTANGPAPTFGSSSTAAPNPFAPATASFTNAAPSTFGTPSAPSFGQPAPAFGQTPSAPAAGFGQAAPASNPFAQFGGSAAPAPSTNMFGAAPAVNGFGSAPAPPSSFGGGFGSAPSSAPTSTFTFGAQANGTSAAPPAFGGFGTNPAAQPQSSGFTFGGGTSASSTPFTPPATANGGGGGFPFGTPAAPNQPNEGAALFNIGAGDAPTSPTGSRRIRPLPSRRGRK